MSLQKRSLIRKKVKKLKQEVRLILNPDSTFIESCYNQIASRPEYLDSIFEKVPQIKASVISSLSDNDLELRNLLNEDRAFLIKEMNAKGFYPVLRNAIDKEYFNFFIYTKNN